MSSQTVAASLKQSVSQGKISASVAQDIIEQLDDIAVAGCGGVSPDDIDSEEITLAAVIIDGSGSMGIYRNAVIDGFNNDFLLPIQGAKNADSIHISVWVFSSEGDPANQVRLIHGYKPASQCPKLSAKDYNPAGGTPLYKAVHYGQTGIFNYGETLQANGTRVKRIVMVLSDGQENDSHGVTSAQVKKFSSDLLKTETCVLSYIYFGDEADGDRYAKDIGFPPQHRLTEDLRKQGASGIRRVFGTASASVITASQSKVAASGLSANAFFTP